MTYVFWLSALLIAYVYAGYPALLAIWGVVRTRHSTDHGPEHLALPGVSIIVAARNEARRLTARVQNLLTLD